MGSERKKDTHKWGVDVMGGGWGRARQILLLAKIAEVGGSVATTKHGGKIGGARTVAPGPPVTHTHN